MTRSASKFLIAPLLCLTPWMAPWGCGGEPAPKINKGADDDAPTAADNVKFELPPPPDFDEGKVAEKWDDGTWSVYGLRKELDENIKTGEAGNTVDVKGYVLEIYEPTPCPENERCIMGKQPHIWIVDKADQQGRKRAMMVVGYRFSIKEADAKTWEKEPEVTFEKGKQYTFRGEFKRTSSTGFSHSQGLLEFKYYRAINPATGAEDWIAPKNSAWHPLTLKMEEERNRKMMENMAKDAKKNKK